MQLFYAPDITLPQYTLSEEESKHAIKVLRLSIGDTLHITDGKGNLHLCRIVSDSAKHCTVCVVESISNFEKRDYNLIMAVAPTKNIDRFEWFLEKATEIGTDSFVALETEHSERRVIKVERETKVITAAVKQSLKAFHPTLEDMTPFKRFVSQEFSGRKFIAHCAESIKEKRYLASTLKAGQDAVILIGPEGDFSAEEIAFAIEHGFEEITLGCQRFRTETAAVMAVAMVAVVNSVKL
ncbi:MAG: 16S rRNA (uracil(1498)-N(3))-methyltransferase [Alistipes sp.]|nr:16S rRNA (uracil(1498)-N(3))-methyltransferase [Alistipes sp.]